MPIGGFHEREEEKESEPDERGIVRDENRQEHEEQMRHDDAARDGLFREGRGGGCCQAPKFARKNDKIERVRETDP